MSKEETFSESMYKAIAIISEICVTESKMEISPKLAVERIRKCMLEVINQDEFSKGYYISLKREIKELKKQLAELKAENERLCQQVININKENNKLRKFQEDILRVQAEPYKFWKEIEELQQQLKEKDEIIKNLERRDKANTNADKVLVAYITNQVCEKIRKMAYDKFDFDICEECGEWVHNSNVITYILILIKF